MSALSTSSPVDLGALDGTWRSPSRKSANGGVMLVLFLLAQGLDGALTYVGIATYGVTVEANPLIVALIAELGDTTALFSAKLTAALLGILLYLRGIHVAITLLTALYVTAAIIPWTALLFF